MDTEDSNAFPIRAYSYVRMSSRKQLRGDSANLLRRLTLTQDHLGQPVAQRAVVVDLREADVLVGQVLQLAHGLIDGRPPLGNGAQQVAQLPLVDSHPPNLSFGQHISAPVRHWRRS